MNPVLREQKPAFLAERLKNTVINFTRTSIVKIEFHEEFMAVFDSFVSEFRDVGFDDSVNDNIRWAIEHKVLGRVLEWCSMELLEDVMLRHFSHKYIFNINIEILATLLLKWKHVVALDKVTLCNMLSVPDSKDGSHLWKMNAIQIIALASSFDVPVLSAEEQRGQAQAEHNFRLLTV